MWKLYAKSDEAIAIQATIVQLLRINRTNNRGPMGAYLGKVKYIDPANELVWPEGNSGRILALHA